MFCEKDWQTAYIDRLLFENKRLTDDVSKRLDEISNLKFEIITRLQFRDNDLLKIKQLNETVVQQSKQIENQKQRVAELQDMLIKAQLATIKEDNHGLPTD